MWLDEWRPEHFDYELLLTLLGDTPMGPVEIKGGWMHWNPELIIITTPDDPVESFKATNHITGDRFFLRGINQDNIRQL